MRHIDRIDHVILNAGILEYPNVGSASLPARYVSQWRFSERLNCEQCARPQSGLRAEHTRSFDAFSRHLRTNTVGPIITVQKLLQTRIPIGTVTFMSSDSGSAGDFRVFEDGYDYVDF